VNLVKTSFYTAISTAVTFISGFVVTKVVAVKIGPGGMAYLGQFQNTTTILSMLAVGAIGAGIIKYLAEYTGNHEKQQQVIVTSLSVILVASMIISVAVMAGSGYLSKAAFHSIGFWEVYFLYGLFVTLISLNTWFSSVYNGLKEIRKLTIVNITGSLSGLLFTTLFAYTWGVKGVLVASNAMAAMVFLLNLYFSRRLPQFVWRPNFKKWDKKLLRLFFSFTLMALVSGLLGPFIQILIRDKIIKDFSLPEAGLWQGISRISDYYLSFITTVLAVYYLPRLSEIKEKAELKKEIGNGYKIILPVVSLLALSIWLLKDVVIQVLFTPEFNGMRPLFKFQLLGDVLKIGSWLLSYVMLSKALVKTFIATEIYFSLQYVVLCYVFMAEFGIIGATYGFCLNYTIYWIVMGLLMKKHIV